VPPICGDDVVNQPSEDCDGAEDDCAGACTVECTCGEPFDDCLLPEVITSMPFSDELRDVSQATTEPGDPVLHCGEGGDPSQYSRSVWYSFTSQMDGVLIADTTGSSPDDTVMAAFTGGCGSLDEVACNDDFADLESRITLPVVAGETYLLEVVAFESGPPGLLSFRASLCGDGQVDDLETCEPADDAACPGLCRSDCTCATTVGDALVPCDAADIWSFDVGAGQSVILEADTTNADTAADLCLIGSCDDGEEFDGDDEFPCRFAPPRYACPLAGFIAASDTTCMVSVETCSANCADPLEADYGLTLRVDDALAPIELIADDQ
jgi:hypothetical protein